MPHNTAVTSGAYQNKNSSERIAVVGLGYVGLPVALACARHYEHVVGFDIAANKVQELASGLDRTGETSRETLQSSSLRFTSQTTDLEGCTFFIVAVPTPVDVDHRPDLSPLRSASELVGGALKPGAVVVYESTVYPGVTEDYCAPILAQKSGLSRAQFKLGYSPERINPADKEHTLERITKVVSGEDAPTTERVAAVYRSFVSAGVFAATSIRVAEAAKVIENTQRDLNIALMNELALIFDRMNIRTKDVLAAASTKWNFLRFSPGLVGGHCIGVDPYYLTTKAEQLGYQPQVILAGRRINNGMGAFIAQKTVKLLVAADKHVKGARVGLLGLTFKENVADLRNSRVPDIVQELEQFGIIALVHDPMVSSADAEHEYGIKLREAHELSELDALIVAVSHQTFINARGHLRNSLTKNGVVVDVKSALSPDDFPQHTYWAL